MTHEMKLKLFTTSTISVFYGLILFSLKFVLMYKFLDVGFYA